MSSTSAVAPTTTTDVAPVADAVLSLTERISKVEELLKDLKRAAKHLEKQVGRRRRRTPRGQKGETPQQLRAWHEEVHRVWEDMKKTDKATLYKKAVAEAARRRGGAPVASSAAAVPSQTPAVVAAQTPAVATKAAKAPRAAKAAKATA